jgi:hypothetical protein
MRALTGGSLVLVFAMVLVSWDAARRYTHARSLPEATFQSPGWAARTPTTREAEAAPRQGVAGAGSVRLEHDKPAARTSAPARSEQSTTRAAPRLRDIPGLAVRQIVPGSKAHAEAIASTVQSEEYRNTVEPLARLYFAFFDRTADFEGLSWYIDERDAGVSLASIADDFAGSTEFRLRYGTLDDAAFVDRLYRNIFDTVPDNAQRAYWIGQLESGMSRGQVMLAFSESPGFRAATANEVFVAMAYAQTLGTHPDPAALAHWARFLDAGHPREAVIAGLLARR